MPSLLDLPHDIRQLIYKDLLVQKAPLDVPKPKFHPAILRTNKKIYKEAHEVLYEQNTFTISLSVVDGEPRARFMNFIRWNSLRRRWQVPRQGEFQFLNQLDRYSKHVRTILISIEICDQRDTRQLASTVEKMCQHLCGFPNLKKLSLVLRGDWDEEVAKLYKNFEVLRNIEQVDFPRLPEAVRRSSPEPVEMPDEVRRNLVAKLTEYSPLPMMYKSLQDHQELLASPSLVRLAYDAARKGDMQLFKGMRARYLQLIDIRVAEGKKTVLENDPSEDTTTLQ